MKEANEFIKSLGTGGFQCTVVRRKKKDQPEFNSSGEMVETV